MDDLSQKAFSVLEVTAVVAIISILTALTVPSFSSITKSYSIGNAGQEVRNTIALARQEATSRNRPVEIRFCRLTSADKVRYVQLVVYEPNGALRMLSRAVKLPENVYVDLDSTRSSLFNNTNAAQGAAGSAFTSNQNNSVVLAQAGVNYELFSFFIRPDGTSNLPWSAGSFPSITLRGDQSSNAPENYATVQMDPSNCRATLLRP